MRFFFYGTLRDEAVREAVLGKARARALDVVPATLGGWRCVFIRRRVYPAIVPDPNREVRGILAAGIDREGHRRLAAFESDEYVVRVLGVTTAAGLRADAHVYAAGPLARPSATTWDFDDWTRDHRAAFLRRIGTLTF